MPQQEITVVNKQPNQAITTNNTSYMAMLLHPSTVLNVANGTQ